MPSAAFPPRTNPQAQRSIPAATFLKGTDRARSKSCKPFVVLGRIAHESLLRTFGIKLKDHPFAHQAHHRLQNGLTMFDSYHCSRYNTNTGRLTPEMFRAVFSDVRSFVDG